MASARYYLTEARAGRRDVRSSRPAPPVEPGHWRHGARVVKRVPGRHMSAQDDFRHESVQDRQSIVKYLQALTAGIEEGRIELGTAEHTLELEPSGMLELQVRAKRKGGRVKLAIKLYWREDDEEPGAETLEIKAGSRA